MKAEKTPALLAVLMKASAQQWFVAAIFSNGQVRPLVRSEPGNLDQYVGLGEEEQLSFLRHRLSGAMQRGCDRLWAEQAKASQIVLIADRDFPDSDDKLLPRLAEHFYTWMTRPPITFYRGSGEATLEDLDTLECLAGELEGDQQDDLQQALPKVCRQLLDETAWEIVPSRKE